MIIEESIVGTQVILRTAGLEDAEFTYNIRQDKLRTKYIHTLHGGIEQQKKWIYDQMKSEDAFFFVLCNLNNEPFGTFAIYEIDKERRIATLGRALLNGNPIQNLEALLLVHDFAFMHLELDCLYNEIYEENTVAMGTNKRVGGVALRTEYNEEFGMNNVFFEISKVNYMRERDKIVNLVNRFGNR